MEIKRVGRPKIENPKNKRISFPVTEKELKKAQIVSAENNITYSDIFFKGLEFWSRK